MRCALWSSLLVAMTAACSSGSSGTPGSSTDASTGGDVVGPSDTGTTTETEPADAGDDGGKARDAGAGGQGVLCPMAGVNARCSGADYCCVSGNPEAGTQTGACEVPDSGTCTGTPISCSNTSDCTTPGLACCGPLGTQGGQVVYQWVRCVSPAVWGCDDVNTVRFCDPANNDCPSATPRCIPSQVLLGYSTCHA